MNNKFISSSDLERIANSCVDDVLTVLENNAPEEASAPATDPPPRTHLNNLLNTPSFVSTSLP